MRNAQDWIKQLNLEPHPEGGFYRQTDLSNMLYAKNGQEFPLYTNIYFLLTKESPSHFHQLTSDELWFFHGGNPLTVHCLKEDGSYQATVLGLEENHKLHHTVKAGEIFGSTVEEGYALVSCTVIPGFDFKDFKLFTQKELLAMFPQHEKIIYKLAYASLEDSPL